MDLVAMAVIAAKAAERRRSRFVNVWILLPLCSLCSSARARLLELARKLLTLVVGDYAESDNLRAVGDWELRIRRLTRLSIRVKSRSGMNHFPEIVVRICIGN
jgi:hypothetical protein